tara:strand:+ start:63402 stop:66407 length:3006 start_codon:yes stop_codon:yes gene_type:complete
MTINTSFKNNIIKSISAKDFYTESATKSLENFRFVFPIVLNKDFIIDAKVKKIQVIFQNKNEFDKSFQNIFLNETENFLSYKQNKNLERVFGNNLQKSIYLNYNTKNNYNSSFNKTYDFQDKNFIENESSFTTKNAVYKIEIDDLTSKKIVNQKISSLRIVFLNEKNESVDQTNIIMFDPVTLKENYKVIGVFNFYEDLLNSFVDNSKLEYYQNEKNIVISHGNITDVNFFKSFNLELVYISKKTYKIEIDQVSTKEKFVIIKNDECLPFVREICKDFLLGRKNFIVELNYNINLNLENSEISKKTKKDKRSKTITKTFNFKDTDRFIRNINLVNQQDIVSNILKNFKQDFKIKSLTNSIESIFEINNFPSFLMENTIVEKILVNNEEIDFIYRSSSFNLENKESYKGKNLNSFLLGQKIKKFWIRKKNRKNKIDIFLKLFNNNLKISSNTIYDKEDYESLIENANIVFKDNLKIPNIRFKIGLNRQNRSLFDMHSIFLEDIDSFRDVAFSFGYHLEGNVNIQEFFDNCIVKIENKTEIPILDFDNNKINYFFFNSLFDTNNIDNNIIRVKNNQILSRINTDDSYMLASTEKNISNKNIIEFFTNQNIETSYRKILNEKDLLLQNKVKISILPFPKIMSQFRGFGLDNLENPVDENINSGVSSEDKNRVSRETTVFFYSANNILNFDRFKNFIRLFYNSESSLLINSYTEMFEYMISTNVENKNIFEKFTSLTLDDIFDSINVNTEITDLDIITSSFEENLMQKYFLFNVENLEIPVVNQSYNTRFSGLRYNSRQNTNTFREILINNTHNNENLYFDISLIQDLYSLQSIRNIVPKIRMSLHFLCTNEDSIIDQSIVENSEFSIVNMNGKNYLTFNDLYMSNQNRRQYFSNFNDYILGENIEVDTNGYKIKINSNQVNNTMNINNISYTAFRDFFNFCKQNNVNILEKIVLRLSCSFKILNDENEEEYITLVTSSLLDRTNMVDQKLIIDNIENVQSIIIT